MRTIFFLIAIIALNISECYAQQAYYDVTYGNGNGIRFWQDNAYKIHMGNTSEYQYGPVTDYSIKMNMGGISGRGWTWGIGGSTPVAALSNQGNMQIAGNFFTMGNLGVGTTSPYSRFSVSDNGAPLNPTNLPGSGGISILAN